MRLEAQKYLYDIQRVRSFMQEVYGGWDSGVQGGDST